MSAATQRMSIQAFETYLVDMLTQATRDALADAVIDGAGTTEPIGVLNGFSWDETNSVTLNTADVLESLTDALALLAPNFSQNATWALSTTTLFTRIATIATSDGVPLIARDPSTSLPQTLLGKPLVLDDFVPTDTIILGDPRFYFLNFSQPMAVEASREAGFASATILYRSLAVVDGRPVAPAFVKIDDGA
jgi:HK97 family phage major capsid protein